MDLRNKRFLITQNDIFSINGSSVIVLELAEYLQSLGARVTVYTYFLEDPLKTIFLERNIRVICSDEGLGLNDFDFIWVHHQVLPLSIINELGQKRKKPLPKFIFNHMSPLDWIADEFPYIWNLENILSSISTFNSLETKERQQNSFSNQLTLELFQNPAPSKFIRAHTELNEYIKKILVVSNHPPEELNKAKVNLEDQGIEVHFIGELQNKYHLVEPDLLADYDVVVTIGKTVQYCLVMGVPVYVYDYFGGPGYLSDQNYELAAHNNFSGRGFSKMSDIDLANDIIGRYADAVTYQLTKHDFYVNIFSMEKVLIRILKQASEKTLPKIDNMYLRYLINSHNYSREHRIAARLRVVCQNELQQTKESITNIKNSRTYKIGRMITKPLRLMKKTFIS